MNPMIIPFVLYQRWLDMIFSSFVQRAEIKQPLKLVPRPTPYEG